MEFSSIGFIWVFLPVTLAIYYALRLIRNRQISEKLCNIFLLAASLFFYAFGGLDSLLLISVMSLFNFFAGIAIERSSRRKLTVSAAILINILLLLYFKYFGMLITLAEMFSNIGNTGLKGLARSMLTFDSTANAVSVIMPLAISFVVFQSVSYLADVGRDTVKAERDPVRFFLFITFFAQITQGPIMRYGTLGEQIRTRDHSISVFSSGIRRFSAGLGKKVIIANTLAAVVDGVWMRESEATLTGIGISTAEAWMAALLYTLQLYCDFSGYSDMAVGLGRIFGFSIDENFNYPYISKSVREFWRRWHISLSSWFRDYVYIPLGGSRKGMGRTLLNTLIVFFLTGLWHGANLNFVVWGLFQAAALIAERLFLGKLLDKNRFKILNHIYTLLFAVISWCLFRAPNLYLAANHIRTMFIYTPTAVNTSLLSYINVDVMAAFAGGILCSLPLRQSLNESRAGNSLSVTFLKDIFCIVILIWSVLLILSGSYNPSIYAAF